MTNQDTLSCFRHCCGPSRRNKSRRCKDNTLLNIERVPKLEWLRTRSIAVGNVAFIHTSSSGSLFSYFYSLWKPGKRIRCRGEAIFLGLATFLSDHNGCGSDVLDISLKILRGRMACAVFDEPESSWNNSTKLEFVLRPFRSGESILL